MLRAGIWLLALARALQAAREALLLRANEHEIGTVLMLWSLVLVMIGAVMVVSHFEKNPGVRP